MLQRMLLTAIPGIVFSFVSLAQVAPVTEKQSVKNSTQTNQIVPSFLFGAAPSSTVGKQWTRVRISPGFQQQDHQQGPASISQNALTLPVFRFPIILCSNLPGNPILLMTGSTIRFQRQGIASPSSTGETPGLVQLK